MKDTLKVIQVVVGDITHFNVDDIVNASNNSLLRGREVDVAIYRTAEKDLLNNIGRLAAILQEKVK